MLINERRCDYRKGIILQHWNEGIITCEWQEEPGRFMRVSRELFTRGSLLPDTIRPRQHFMLLGIPFVALRQDFESQSWTCLRTDLPFTFAARAFDAVWYGLITAEQGLYRLLWRSHLIDQPQGQGGEWRNLRGLGRLRARLNARRDARFSAWLHREGVRVRQPKERVSA